MRRLTLRRMHTPSQNNASDQDEPTFVNVGSRRAPKVRRRANRAVLQVMEVEPRVVPSLTISFDYRYDSANFFDTQAKRDLLQQAANTFASQINDSLSAIIPGGFNTWTAKFPNPSTGALQSLSNLVVPANTLIIFVGGGHLAGQSEAGEGSTGGYEASGDPATWLPTVAARGQSGVLASPPTDFAPWGGSIAFDNSGVTNWYFGQSVAGIGSNQTDFYSVAQHEIGHILGIGTSDSWAAKVSAGRFTGSNAVAAYGGQPVPVNSAGDHWAQGVKSEGSNALMNPILVNGSRVTATALDLAALRDLGWQVQAAAKPSVQFAVATSTAVEATGGFVVTITRTGGSGAFSVDYTTVDGTAKAGLDYQAASGTLNFAAGEMSKSLTITILGDSLLEGTESLSLVLSSPTAGATLGTPATTVVNISDPTQYRASSDFGPDGRSDPGVFRPGTATWYILNGAAGQITPAPVFGAANLFDIPVVGDFEGLGRAQIGVFRPSTAQWFVLGPSGGRLLGSFGATNLYDIPVPGDYDGDGRTEMAVFRPSTAEWFAMGPSGGRLLGSFGATNLYDIPAPGDYDGLGRTQPAVFRPSTGQWFVLGASGGRWLGTYGLTNYADVPIQAPTASLLALGKFGGGGVKAAAIPLAGGSRAGTSAAVETARTSTLAATDRSPSQRKAAEALTQLAARRRIRPAEFLASSRGARAVLPV